jgi:probable rRNA maturation factor
MIDFDNETEYELNLELLEKIASNLSDRDLELILTDNDTIKEINKEHRGKDKATDVLSFPMEDMPMAPLGSIIISLDIAQEKSNELGHNLDDEIALLFIHGLLHLLGYDHEVDNGEMRIEEERLIKEYNLPDSLIIRTEG